MVELRDKKIVIHKGEQGVVDMLNWEYFAIINTYLTAIVEFNGINGEVG